MRSLLFTSAAIAIVAHAQDNSIFFGDPIQISTATSGAISSSGEMGEVLITDSSGAEPTHQVWLYIKWTTGTTSKNDLWGSGT